MVQTQLVTLTPSLMCEREGGGGVDERWEPFRFYLLNVPFCTLPGNMFVSAHDQRRGRSRPPPLSCSTLKISITSPHATRLFFDTCKDVKLPSTIIYDRCHSLGTSPF